MARGTHIIGATDSYKIQISYESTNVERQGRQENGKVIYKELSYRIVGVLFTAYNELGSGLQEKYYQRAIEKLLKENSISFESQVPYKIALKGETIGRYFLDFLIEDKVILEIKKGNRFSKRNIEQVKGYLHVTKKQLALLANFTSDGVHFMRILNLYQKDS